jgi:hypothetical protein
MRFRSANRLIAAAALLSRTTRGCRTAEADRINDDNFD